MDHEITNSFAKLIHIILHGKKKCHNIKSKNVSGSFSFHRARPGIIFDSSDAVQFLIESN